VAPTACFKEFENGMLQSELKDRAELQKTVSGYIGVIICRRGKQALGPGGVPVLIETSTRIKLRHRASDF